MLRGLGVRCENELFRNKLMPVAFLFTTRWASLEDNSCINRVIGDAFSELHKSVRGPESDDAQSLKSWRQQAQLSRCVACLQNTSKLLFLPLICQNMEVEGAELGAIVGNVVDVLCNDIVDTLRSDRTRI